MEDEEWARIGAAVLRRRRPGPLSDRVFHQHFGVHLVTLVGIWPGLCVRWPSVSDEPLDAHTFLVSLFFLRCYPTDNQLISVLGNASRARLRIWPIIIGLANVLPLVI